MEIRTPWGYDRRLASLQSGLACTDPTRTDQSAKDECDINYVVRQFGVTGVLPQSVRMPKYEDFEDASDYQTSLNAIASARESFDQMPATVRDRFRNDPGVFVDFCQDPANHAEARKLGLLVPEVQQLTATAPQATLQPLQQQQQTQLTLPTVTPTT